MKKIVILAALFLAIAGQAKAYTVYVMNSTTQPISAILGCPNCGGGTSYRSIEPGERMNYGAEGCICHLVIAYPDGSSATIHGIHPAGQKTYTVVQYKDGSYHWQ